MFKSRLVRRLIIGMLVITMMIPVSEYLSFAHQIDGVENNWIESNEMKFHQEDNIPYEAHDYRAVDFYSMYYESIQAFNVVNPADDGNWFWPVPSHRAISSAFGVRNFAASPNHRGIDISPGSAAAERGVAVHAARAGRIVQVERNFSCRASGSFTGRTRSRGYTGSWGNLIWIYHPGTGGLRSLYSHMQGGSIPSNIAVGRYVYAGQFLGLIGNSGFSTGPHLHFEIRDGNGRSINTNVTRAMADANQIRPQGLTIAQITKASDLPTSMAVRGMPGMRYRIAGFPAVPAPTFGISLSQSGRHTFPARTLPNYALPGAHTITVRNTGNQSTGALRIENTNPTAFTITPASFGSIATNSFATFRVQPRGNLRAGTHTATITVRGAANITARSFTVSFTVNEASTWGIGLSQTGTHSFPSRTLPDYSLPPAHSVTVRNTGNQGTGALMIANSNPNAFTVNVASLANIPAGATTRTFTVQPRVGLASGVHTAVITVSGASVSDRTFNVSFRVHPALDNSRNTISAGNGSSFHIRDDGSLWVWGRNDKGQLGDNTTIRRYLPTRIGNETNWVSINSQARGNNVNVSGIRADGSLWAWGLNDRGQLGDGTRVDRHMPTQIGNSTNWSAVTISPLSGIGVQTDGSLWTWGGNENYQLGIGVGTAIRRETPSRVGNTYDWRIATMGGSDAVGIRADGSLWVWGSTIGMSPSADNSTPIRVGTCTNWVYVSMGGQFAVALQSDGSLWAWGGNWSGQLGDGTTTARLTPSRVGVDTDWVSVSAGSSHVVAVRADGSLWAWGSNGAGQLGDGTTIERHTPTRVGVDTDWISVDAGSGHNLALRADGSLWGWGSNLHGQLGDGTTMNHLEPRQIYPLPVQINVTHEELQYSDELDLIIYLDTNAGLSVIDLTLPIPVGFEVVSVATGGLMTMERLPSGDENLLLLRFKSPTDSNIQGTGALGTIRLRMLPGATGGQRTIAIEGVEAMNMAGETFIATTGYTTITVPETFSINVINNNQNWGVAWASAQHARPGEEIALEAFAQSQVGTAGYFEFVRWEVVSGGATIAELYSSATDFIMPQSDVLIRAIFQAIQQPVYVEVYANNHNLGEVIITDWVASEGTTIGIHAMPHSGVTFSHWEIIEGDVQIANIYSAETSFIATDNSIIIEAIFRKPFEYQMIVIESNDSSWGVATASCAAAPVGAIVSLVASDHDWDGDFAFAYWETLSEEIIIDNPLSSETFFVMPAIEPLVCGCGYEDGDLNALSLASEGGGGVAFIRAVFHPKTGTGGQITVEVNDEELGIAWAFYDVALEGTNVSLLAAVFNPDWSEFVRWEVIAGNVVIDDLESFETFFLMPANDVTIRAVFGGDVILLGDINGDGNVNILDLQLLLRHVSRRNILTDDRQLLAADVNRDGNVDILDLRLLLQYVSRRIDSFN